MASTGIPSNVTMQTSPAQRSTEQLVPHGIPTEYLESKKLKLALQADNRRRSRQREKELVRFQLPAADYGVLPGRYHRHTFVANLIENSRPCELSDKWKDTAVECMQLNKGELLDAFADACRNPIKSDCTIVQNAAELSAALQSADDIIYAPAECGLSHTQDWSIEKQIKQLGNGTVDANLGQAFKTFNARELRQCLVDATETQPPFNILDLQYWTELSFLPTIVFDHSLLHQLDLVERSGQQGRGTKTGSSEKWMILTHGPTDSPFHADQGGKCTIICGIEGKKIWHVPVGERATIRKVFRIKGPCETRFLEGSVRLVVGPGDILIQSPGTPHAVVTPTDALIAGIFIYTAASYHQSIECIALWFQKELISNDDMKPEDLLNHIRILNHLHSSLFNDQQRSAVLVELAFLLRERKCIAENLVGGEGSLWIICPKHTWDLNAPSLSRAEIGTFLQACVTAWDPSYTDEPPANNPRKGLHPRKRRRNILQ